jgi:glycosyltransferase involved in cell wall biosynthesis
MKLSIIIPCYNEEQNISLILERFKGVISREDIEVLLVDNGSTDGSAQTLESLLPNYPFARSVTVKVNEGYGNGILQGLAAGKGEVLAWTHADMQTDPKDVITALELFEAQPVPKMSYVKGLRQGRPLSETFFTFGMSMFETIFLGKKLWDINAQPNMFHRDFYLDWDNPPKDFSLDLFVYYTALKQGMTETRFDVIFPERLHGESTWNTGFKSKYKFIKRTISFSLSLKKVLK